MKAIVLAATRGNELRELTKDKPKAMINIGGKSLLRRQIDELKRLGINQTTVVAGYKAKSIKIAGINKLVNKEFKENNELASLACAENDFGDDMLIIYGDLLFRGYILRDLLESPGEIVAVVDSALDNPNLSGSPDFAYCSKKDDRSPFMRDVMLEKLDSECRNKQPSGYWIGMLRIRKQGKRWIEKALADLRKHKNFNLLTIPDLLNYLIDSGKPINVHYIDGHWLDVNSLDDIDRAGNFTI